MEKDAPLKTPVPPSAPGPWWLSCIRTYPVVILTGILSVIGGAYAVGEVVGELRGPTRVDEAVDALSTQVETQIDALSTQVETDLSTQVETFDDYAQRTEVSALILSNEVEDLRTQVQALASYVEDLRIEAAANNEVDALRTRVLALVAVASNEVEALRTQVLALVEPPQTTALMADVVNLRFLVHTLSIRLVTVAVSVGVIDEIEVLNNQMEMLQEIMDCSIAQTEIVHRHLETRTAFELTLNNNLPRIGTPMVKSCTELLGRLGVG